jgi:NhaP-type Na+/H+ or K+/H+ antiporter
VVLVLIYGGTLLVVVLVSGLAARTVLSTSLMFLLAGGLAGAGGFGWLTITPHSPIVSTLADLALFAVLFTDGQRAGVPELRRAWRLSGRALLLGMPLTFLGVAVLAHYIAGLDWTTAFLVGAVLSPTDPVFASAIVTRQDVPDRLRQLLNIESGLNDGLALPVVVVLIAAASKTGTSSSASISTVLIELIAGLALGVALPTAAAWVVKLPLLGSEPRFQPLSPVALAVILYAVCHLTGANPYLAAFAAGSTVATFAPEARDAFEEFGDLLAELAKFAAVLVFGALLTPTLFAQTSAGAYLVAVLTLILVRPTSLLLSLIGARLSRREKAAAAWFGPKGFASVVYGLLVLQSQVPQAMPAFNLIAVTITLSIVLHSSTDVPVARLFHMEDVAGMPEAERGDGAVEPT